MKREARRLLAVTTDSTGFTLVEVVFVIVILGVMIAMAVSSLRNWRPTLDSKQTATTLVNLLREARSKAVATNYQYKIDFDVPNRRYRMQQGNQAYNTPASGWQSVPGYNWIPISNGVTITSGGSCNVSSTVDVQFNANGTAYLETPWTTVSATPVTVCIQGGAGTKTYRIVASGAGAILLQ